MSVATLMAAGRGGLEFCLTVEGIDTGFCTNVTGTWSGLPSGVTPAKGTLRRQDMRTGQSVSLASAELSAQGLTFRLVDGFDSAGNPFLVSALMTGLSAANVTRLTATLGTGGGPALVESTSAFPASGDIYCELETIGYASVGATQFDAALTRGKYGSKEVVHTFEAADADDVRADFGLIPEVTDRPVSWYGRRCTLWVAEVLPGGATLGTASQRWKGRIAGDIEVDGAEWVIPAESLWDTLATEILAGQPKTRVRGLRLAGAVTVGVIMDSAGGTLTGSFDVPAATYTIEGFLTAVTDLMNAEIASLAGPPAERYELFADGARLMARQTAPAGAGTYVTALYCAPDTADGAIVGAALAATDEAITNFDAARARGIGRTNVGLVLPSLDNDPALVGAAVAAAVAFDGEHRAVIPCERLEDFSAWSEEGDNYWSISLATIDGEPYILEAVNAATGVITLSPMTDRNLQQGQAPTAQIQMAGAPPLEVRLGVWIRGTLPLLWRDAFIDNANVPLSMTAGIDSTDIDWTDLAGRVPGGLMAERDRLLTEPVSFRDLLAEDLAWCGLVPMVQLNGQISARPIANQGLVRDDHTEPPTIDNETLVANDAPVMQWGTKRVVNRLEMTATREYGRGWGFAGMPAFEVNVTLNDRQSQGRYRLINSSELTNSAMGHVTERDIAAHAYGLASSIFALCARDYPIVKLQCLGALYAVLPLDSVFLTHWLLPSPSAPNERGMVDVLCTVTGVVVDWTAYTVELDLLVLTDGGKRSGFAPVARIISYTDMGGGTEPQRYRLEVEPDYYSDYGEGNFFAANMRVELREWDDDSAPASESRVVSAVAADGGYIYLTAAPSAGMQAVISGGTCNITLDQYDTANQTDPAKLYLHVADDADNLLGTSGVLGFLMG